MKKIFVMFAMSALALTSCLQEENPVVDNNGENDAFEPSGELVEKVFTVGEIKSKTYIDGTVEEGSGDIVLKWCADDAISVWDGVANRKFTMVGEPDGASATFKGYVDAAATEFYAFYPYSEALAHKVASSKHVFSFPKSNIQYANPEGGLADGAAFACAKVENDLISFAANSCMLKFSLAEGMEVKSVTLKGNETDDVLAGTTNFTYNGTTFMPGFEQSLEKFNEITLCNQDGSNLKTGTDYYIALQGNEYNAGYTVSLALADGTVYSKSSSKAAQYRSGTVYNLSAKPLSHGMFDYYKGYLAGEDIVIAGKVYNKTTHPDAKLLTETTTISSNGLYFLAPSEGQTITLGTTRVDEMVLVGNNPSNRTQVISNEGFKLKQNGCVAALNVELSTITVSNKQLIDENTYAESASFDNCKIYAPTGSSTSFVYNQVKDANQVNITASTTTIGEFSMCNCDYVMPKESAENNSGAAMLNCGTKGTNITLENNLFYVAEPDIAAIRFKVTSVASSETGNLIMKNNTFINTCQNAGVAGFFTNGIEFTSIDVQNNLFYLPLMTVNHYVFMVGLNFGGGTVENNAYYKGALSHTFRMFNGSQNTPSFALPDLTQLSASPFSSMDHTNGVFVKTAEAAAYGAKR